MAIWSIFGHLGYLMAIWYILCSFGTFFPVLVSSTKKNLATLVESKPIRRVNGRNEADLGTLGR
jgi:hypothetical protein